MHKLLMNVRTAMDSCKFAEADRGAFLCFALGQTLAYTLALPSAPVSSPSAHYNNVHLATVGKIISTFNEEMVIDVPQAMKTVKDFYEFRYRLVFDPTDKEVVKIMEIMTGGQPDSISPKHAALQSAVQGSPQFETLKELLWNFRREWTEMKNEGNIA